MANGRNEVRTPDGLLVVSTAPGRRWAQLALGAVLLGVPLARALDGPGGLAPPALTSFFMAFMGVVVLAQWLILQGVREQHRKAVAAGMGRPDGAVVTVRPTWVVTGQRPALVVFLEDRGTSLGWLPAGAMHPAFEPRGPYAVVGEVTPGQAVLLRARAVGQAVVGAVRPPEPPPAASHPLAPTAAQLVGWAPTGSETIGGATGFEPVTARSAGAGVDPALRLAADAARARLETVYRALVAVAVVAVVVLIGNADGLAGLGICLAIAMVPWAARPALRWADAPLADHLATVTGVSAADARTLATMLKSAGLGRSTGDGSTAAPPPAPPTPPAGPPPPPGGAGQAF